MKVKHKKRLLLLFLTTISAFCLAFGLSACGDSDGETSDWENGVYTVAAAYAEAQDLGYTGTLEEFIASISGSDGIGITSIDLNSNNELVITLSSGSTVNLGNIVGEDGEDGSVWYTDSGEPSDDLGKDGDMYLDTDTYDIYQKEDGSWTAVGNIKGEDGEDLTADTVTLSFDLGYSTTATIASVKVTKGDCVDLPVPERDGYKFIGWYYGTGANAGQVTNVTPISRDMTVTAKWESVTWSADVPSSVIAGATNTFSLYYYGNSEVETVSISITYGNGINVYNFTVDGDVEEKEADAYKLSVGAYSLSTEYYYGINFAEICFNNVGTYTITVTCGTESYEFEIEASYFEYLSTATSYVYTNQSIFYEFNYYGTSTETPVLTISDGEEYTVTYTLTEEWAQKEDDTTYVSYYYDNYDIMWFMSDVDFNVAGTYTITITFGSDSTSFVVNVTDYVFTGDIETTDYVFSYGAWEEFSDNATITEYDTDATTIEFEFVAPKDATVTVTIDGKAVDADNYYHYGDYGTVYVYVDILDALNSVAGTYTVIVTVSHEDYGSASYTITYVLKSTPAYISYIGIGGSGFSGAMSSSFYGDKDDTDVKYTKEDVIEALISTDGSFEVQIFVINPSAVTVTVNGQTLGDTYWSYENDDGESDYCIISIKYSALTAGMVNTVVVTATGDNGTATATLNLSFVSWNVDKYDDEITTGDSVYINTTYYSSSSVSYPTITISGTNYNGEAFTDKYTITTDGETLINDTTNTAYPTYYLVLYYSNWDSDLKENYLNGSIRVYVAGTFTVTIAYGEETYTITFTVKESTYSSEVSFVSVAYTGDNGSYNYPYLATENVTISGETENVYYFVASEDGTITITTSSDSELDSYGYLYQGEELLKSDDDSGSDLNFLITYSVTAGQFYKIVVRGQSWSSGTVTLIVSCDKYFVLGTDDNSLVKPESRTFSISDTTSDTNTDSFICYQFEAAKGATVTVTVNGTVVEVSSATTNIYTVWYMGTLYVYVSPKLCTGLTAGNYTVVVTVSYTDSEGNEYSDSFTFTYTLTAATSGNE